MRQARAAADAPVADNGISFFEVSLAADLTDNRWFGCCSNVRCASQHQHEAKHCPSHRTSATGTPATGCCRHSCTGLQCVLFYPVTFVLFSSSTHGDTFENARFAALVGNPLHVPCYRSVAPRSSSSQPCAKTSESSVVPERAVETSKKTNIFLNFFKHFSS